MKTNLLTLNHWHGYLTIENAEAVGAEIQRRIGEKSVTVVVDNPSVVNLEIYPEQPLMQTGGYTDPESARITLRFQNRNIHLDIEHHEHQSESLLLNKAWFVVLRGGDIRIRKEHFGRNDEPYRIVILIKE